MQRSSCSFLGLVFRRVILSALTALSGVVALSQPASASDITVAAPVNGTSVSSPVWMRAHNVGCNGLTPTSFGYSIDNSSTLTRGITIYDIDTRVGISAGAHTIHYKSWVNGAACPVVSTTFTVAGGSSSSSGSTSGSSTGSNAVTSLPSTAVASALLDGMSAWTSEHDAGTPGSSKGSMVYPATTPSYDKAREFYMTYSSGAGERWHVSFGNNPTAMNFVLDTYVYLVNPSQVANLELDLNQVTSSGKTMMFDTQCSSYSKTWEYTVVSGSTNHWTRSNIYCNPLTWKAKTWHHIQIGMHRDTSGNITHDWVNLDGTHSVFKNAKGYGTRSLGWAKGTLLTNFQIDGLSKGSGSITAYIHNMVFYHW
jgi:hypothetical protein